MQEREIMKKRIRILIPVCVTTHYMEEAEYCDRVAMIYKGRMIALDTPHHLKTRLMDAHILDIRCARPQEIIDVVSALPEVQDVALFGAGLHVKVADPDAADTALSNLMEQKQRPEAVMARILPTMEDVFVSLIEKEDNGKGRGI